jgi:hypothetical protein
MSDVWMGVVPRRQLIGIVEGALPHSRVHSAMTFSRSVESDISRSSGKSRSRSISRFGTGIHDRTRLAGLSVTRNPILPRTMARGSVAAERCNLAWQRLSRCSRKVRLRSLASSGLAIWKHGAAVVRTSAAAL